MHLSTKVVAAAVVTAGLSLAALPQRAEAATILAFGQVGTASTITATAGVGSTTITGTDIAVTLTSFLGGGAPLNAFLDLSASSTGPAAGAQQPFSGSFSITSAALGGTNYLSGTFTALFIGLGAAGSVLASDPPGTVTFTSDILLPDQLGQTRAVSFSFTDLAPLLTGSPCGIVPTTCSFTSNISGNMSADRVAIPEPASLALLGMGLVGLGLSRRRRPA